MTDGQDGGRWALAGFLYQLVGTLSVAVPIGAASNVPITDLKNIDLLLSIRNMGTPIRIHPEQLGQDAVFTSGDECVIAQFKYSADANSTISRNELKEIIKKLKSAARQAKAQGQIVTACCLVTNRRFTTRGRSSQKLWDTTTQQTHSYAFRYKLASTAEWAERLRSFARSYGAIDSEIETRTNELVGSLIKQIGETQGDVVVTLDDFVRVYTGSPHSRRLTIEVTATLSRRRMDQFNQGISAIQHGNILIERDVFQQISRASKERALIVLYGPGGSGKSVALLQMMKEVLDQHSSCCTIEFARNIPSNWVVDVVGEWRSQSGAINNDTPEVAIQRLVNANPNRKPVLWLGMDGLDEGIELVDQKIYVQKLIRWFWDMETRLPQGSPPLATLIVTCRKESDFKRLMDFGPGYSGSYPEAIRVAEFTPDELEIAERTVFPDFKLHLPSLGQSPNYASPMPLGSSTPYSAVTLIDPEAARALKHPAMWHALMTLETGVQRKALIGEAEALRDWGGKFVQWFQHKARLHISQPVLDTQSLLRVLGVIAQHCGSVQPLRMVDNWINPATQTGIVTGAIAEMLYKEALSSGMVEEDAISYSRWRHRPVLDYLLSLS
ncbi:MAG: hypothetical protein M1132_10965 [Chloroflexi bacterium]|nr:hypothetical protein [Chloroflexota bacterium]